uniref:Tyr recombinase domain-containing protein n=1 Tax=Biomphalaria glabrata TaxID=6526 RepID=A0A2C9LLU6_BIOGL
MERLINRKQQNVHLPFSEDEVKAIKASGDKLALLLLYTGLRREELPFLYKSSNYEGGAVKILGKGDKFRVLPINETISKLVEETKNRFSWVSSRTINNHFARLQIKLGFKCNPHRFRATFATNLISNGFDLVTIQTLMGHASVNMTAKYIKIDIRSQRNAIDMITSPEYFIDGMSPEEMKKEIIKLRARLNRMSNG